jgi:hypothetical protein
VSILASTAPPALRDELRRSGHEVWLYDNASALGHDPAWSRFVFGFWGWRSGAAGITAWTHPLFSYSPYFGRARIDSLGRPIPRFDRTGVPVSTLEWEAIREGVADRRFVDTLLSSIESARGLGLPEAAARAQGLLDSLWTELRPDLSDYPEASTRWTLARLDSVRLHLSEANLSLTREIGSRHAPSSKTATGSGALGAEPLGVSQDAGKGPEPD